MKRQSPMAFKILWLCWENPKTWKQLKEETKLADSTLYTILQRFEKRGYIRKVENLYETTEAGYSFLIRNIGTSVLEEPLSEEERRRIVEIIKESEEIRPLIESYIDRIYERIERKTIFSKILSAFSIGKRGFEKPVEDFIAHILSHSVVVNISTNAVVNREDLFRDTLRYVGLILAFNERRLRYVRSFSVRIDFNIENGFEEALKWLSEEIKKATDEKRRIALEVLETIVKTEKEEVMDDILYTIMDISQE